MSIVVRHINEKAGTFKTRFLSFIENETEIDVVPFNEWKKVPPKQELTIIVKNLIIPRKTFITHVLHSTRYTALVNPFFKLNKQDTQEIIGGLGISIPRMGHDVTIPPWVIKPLRGECGFNIRLSFNNPAPGEYKQEFLGVPESLGTSFDVRVYTFLGRFIGSTIRMAYPYNIKNENGILFGVSNTHKEGSLAHFEPGIKHRCSSEMFPYFEKIRSWLGMRGPSEDMKKAATEISEIFELGYCGIDFIFDKDKKFYVIDVNPNAMQGNRWTQDLIRLKRIPKIIKEVEESI